MGKLLGDRTARRVVELVNEADGTAANIRRRRDQILQDNLVFRNDSAEIVPAYGCLRITGAEEDPNTENYVVIAQKPNSTGGVFVFNGSAEVEVGGFGLAYTGVVRAAFASGTPAAGETWGPLSAWTIVSNGFPAVLTYGAISTDLLYGKTLDVSSAAFPISLTQTGGAVGSPTVATSWTYTVTHAITGVTLGTTVDPEASPHLYRRETLGKLIAAIAGTGFYNSSGTFVILHIHEPIDPSEC